MIQHWVRFSQNEKSHFGTLQHNTINVYAGDMFACPKPTGQTLPLSTVTLLTPTQPGKMIALWNNFHALAGKLGAPIPAEPLYLLKAGNSFLATDQTIKRPASYHGKIVYEGELGIVVGKVCKEVSEDEAKQHIFGYTCVNDVTAAELIHKDPSFPQWARAKSFDTFGVFGPVIANGLDPATLVVRTILNGEERQNYPVSDMIFPPAKLLSLLSHDMTLYPGDVIACGTSLGVGSMRPGSRINVVIEGIGTLSNLFE